MKIITEAKFVGDGIVSAKFDGKAFSFNNVLSNDHYAAIVEAGITPSAYVVPAISIEEIRAKRNALLTASDYVVTKSLEAEDAVPSAWVSYRTALRDFPAAVDLADIKWPDPPS
jgi:hypothetical protein|tara:strand:- start:1677 stop:2018 length:342 start_codon:yes stop_codon:yes gene_type:complete